MHGFSLSLLDDVPESSAPKKSKHEEEEEEEEIGTT